MLLEGEMVHAKVKRWEMLSLSRKLHAFAKACKVPQGCRAEAQEVSRGWAGSALKCRSRDQTSV